ncbi:MAG TPA: hypothetical protein VGN12_30315 [Pirellulales bacterium]|jgi:hypothetical protein
MDGSNVAPDPSRRIPSDFRRRLKSVGSNLRPKRIAKGVKFPMPPGNDGPHRLEMTAFLKKFVGGPHERKVFNAYFDLSRSSLSDEPLIEDAAAKAGLTRDEYVCLETLDGLRRFTAESGLLRADAAVANQDVPSYLGDGKLRIGLQVLALGMTEDDVVRAMIYERGCAKLSALPAGAPKVLKRMRSKYPGLDIRLPGGKSNGGYRMTIADARHQMAATD